MGLLSGLFGGEGGSSTTTTTTTQSDERIAATDEAVVVVLSDGSALTLTDPFALDSVEATVGVFENLIAGLIGFAGKESDRAATLAERLIDLKEDPETRTFLDLAKWAALVALGVVAMRAFKGG